MSNAFTTMTADEVYDIMAYEIGLEALNEEIVKAIDEDQLMDILEYVARLHCLDLEHYNEDEDGFNIE